MHSVVSDVAHEFLSTLSTKRVCDVRASMIMGHSLRNKSVKRVTNDYSGVTRASLVAAAAQQQTQTDNTAAGKLPRDGCV